MIPINFPGVNKTYAKDQPQYIPLPVMALEGVEGEVYSCWQLSEEEIEDIRRTGKLYISQLTFNKRLQPLRPMTKLEDGIELINEI